MWLTLTITSINEQFLLHDGKWCDNQYHTTTSTKILLQHFLVVNNHGLYSEHSAVNTVQEAQNIEVDTHWQTQNAVSRTQWS